MGTLLTLTPLSRECICREKDAGENESKISESRRGCG